MELMPAVRALHLFALAVLAGGFSFPMFLLPPRRPPNRSAHLSAAGWRVCGSGLLAWRWRPGLPGC
jgi:hypothetical protein